MLARVSVGRVESEIWVVHGSQGIRVLRFVLLGIGLVNPLKGVHEPDVISLELRDICERHTCDPMLV